MNKLYAILFSIFIGILSLHASVDQEIDLCTAIKNGNVDSFYGALNHYGDLNSELRERLQVKITLEAKKIESKKVPKLFEKLKTRSNQELFIFGSIAVMIQVVGLLTVYRNFPYVDIPLTRSSIWPLLLSAYGACLNTEGGWMLVECFRQFGRKKELQSKYKKLDDHFRNLLIMQSVLRDQGKSSSDLLKIA